ncbi:MAG: AtpZ/AtpI family protein [Candidatus Dadabacteria bacterium]|nr:AtpZ/AtpI family protein [Candidatus Dadabacteria bacterium]
MRFNRAYEKGDRPDASGHTRIASGDFPGRVEIRNPNWLFFTVVGIEFGFSVIAGLFLGDYIDGKLDTAFPFFTLLGLVCGVVAGLTLLLRTLKLRQKRENGNDEKS